jgi:hypothetical protein
MWQDDIEDEKAHGNHIVGIVARNQDKTCSTEHGANLTSCYNNQNT